MDDLVLTDNEVRGVLERMNGEAEARSMLHGEFIELGNGVREHIEDIHDALTLLSRQDELLAARTAAGFTLLLRLIDRPSRLARIRAYIGNTYKGLLQRSPSY